MVIQSPKWHLSCFLKCFLNILTDCCVRLQTEPGLKKKKKEKKRKEKSNIVVCAVFVMIGYIMCWNQLKEN